MDYNVPLSDDELREFNHILNVQAKHKTPDLQLIHYGIRTFLTSSDKKLQAKVFTQLCKVTALEGRYHICQTWLDTRNEHLAKLIMEKQWVVRSDPRLKVFTALRSSQLTELIEPSSNEIEPLVEACKDKEFDMAEAAQALILNLPASYCQRLADLWLKWRTPVLIEFLAQNDYMPATPIETRVMLALQLEKVGVITDGEPNVVPTLAHACQDVDPIIAERAYRLVQTMARPDLQTALCNYVIRENLPTAQTAVLAGGYLPSDPAQKALFYFLTEQWERYEILDFDHRMLRLVYDGSEVGLKRRIADKIRQLGKVEYLEILASNSRLAKLTKNEAILLVDILAANQQWTRLWELALDLPLVASVQALKLLGQVQNWQCPDQTLFADLNLLAQTEMIIDTYDVRVGTQAALFRAKANVPGRINALAFSPSLTTLAIGTGQNKVVLWDLQKGQIEQVYDGFEHSIGEIAYLPDGTLVCAERTSQKQAICSLYAWQDGQRFLLGKHTGSIVALAAVDNEHVLMSGQDGRVVLWSIKYRAAIKELRLPSSLAWQICVSHDRRRAALLNEQACIVSLPDLVLSGNIATLLHGVSKEAVFTPDDTTLLIGKTDGEIIAYQLNGKDQLSERLDGMRLNQNLQALAMLKNLNLLLVAFANGDIDVIDWTTRAKVGRISAPGHRLTSLQISPDARFMAIGDSNASFTLWDLRILELQNLFSLPLAQGRPVHLSALTTVKESDLEIPPTLQAAFDYIDMVLRHRFRYDIELADEPLISIGEFDIEIEG